MPGKFRFGIVAMCDAVYKDEKSNKGILAGVYSGDALVERFPAELQVAFYVDVTPDTSGDHDAELQIYINGKKRMAASLKLGDTRAGIPVTLLIPTLPIRVDKPSKFEMKFFAEGERPVSILKKDISLRGPSTEPPPPS